MTDGGPTLDDVHRARHRLGAVARHSPLVSSQDEGGWGGAEVRLKLESTQDTRSFKVRGAGNAILTLSESDRNRGVVTYSTGNHGRACAHVGKKLGIPVTVCVSSNTTADKRAALRRMGADLRVVGDSQDEAADHAVTLATGEGLSLIDPINDPATTAGDATIALELLEDWPEIDTVVVPVSGGALVAGIAFVVKAMAPAVKVIGVSMETGAAMYQSLRAGRPVMVAEASSLADSLQGGISLDNTHTFEMVRRLVDDLVLVTEDQIAGAMARAFRSERLVLEGAAACPIAAVLAGGSPHLGRRIALIATGGMVDAAQLCRITQRHENPIRPDKE